MKNIYKEWLKGIKVKNKPNEWEVKELFKLVGLETPVGCLLRSGETLKKSELNYPVVAKVCDSSILHKTDIGGVHLNISEDTIDSVIESLRSIFPSKDILVEEMVKYSNPELIIGSMVDPVFGPAIMVGAGGILTELYEDVTFRLVPLTEKQANIMLGELKISELLNGYRGEKMDRKSLVKILCNISVLVDAIGDDFSQLDINPIVFTGEKWVSLDGVLILNREE